MHPKLFITSVDFAAGYFLSTAKTSGNWGKAHYINVSSNAFAIAFGAAGGAPGIGVPGVFIGSTTGAYIGSWFGEFVYNFVQSDVGGSFLKFLNDWKNYTQEQISKFIKDFFD